MDVMMVLSLFVKFDRKVSPLSSIDWRKEIQQDYKRFFFPLVFLVFDEIYKSISFSSREILMSVGGCLGMEAKIGVR